MSWYSFSLSRKNIEDNEDAKKIIETPKYKKIIKLHNIYRDVLGKKHPWMYKKKIAQSILCMVHYNKRCPLTVEDGVRAVLRGVTGSVRVLVASRFNLRRSCLSSCQPSVKKWSKWKMVERIRHFTPQEISGNCTMSWARKSIKISILSVFVKLQSWWIQPLHC